MKDDEKAGRFAKDLEALQEGKEPSDGADLKALALAHSLSKLDFSAESRVRLSLRARLLGRPRQSVISARSVLAAAFAALLLIPLQRVWRNPSIPNPAMPAPERAAPRQEGSLPAAPKLRPAEIPSAPARAEGLFRAVPGSPFVTTIGRQISTRAGRAVMWKLDEATFVLERRPVKIEDLFVRPTL